MHSTFFVFIVSYRCFWDHCNLKFPSAQFIEGFINLEGTAEVKTGVSPLTALLPRLTVIFLLLCGSQLNIRLKKSTTINAQPSVVIITLMINSYHRMAVTLIEAAAHDIQPYHDGLL